MDGEVKQITRARSRKGSALLKEVTEQRERSKMKKRFWELGGSRMGDAMGIKADNDEEGGGEGGEGGKGEADGDFDYRKVEWSQCNHSMEPWSQSKREGGRLTTARTRASRST